MEEIIDQFIVLTCRMDLMGSQLIDNWHGTHILYQLKMNGSHQLQQLPNQLDHTRKYIEHIY